MIIAFENSGVKLTLISATLFFVLSFVWNVYFIKRIMIFVHLYRESIKQEKTDHFNTVLQTSLYHKADIHKYVFLLLLNITEFIAIQMYTFGSTLAGMQAPHEIHDFQYNASCRIHHVGHFNNINIQLIVGNPIPSVLVSIGQVGMIFSLALSICLMKFLNDTFHDIHSKPFLYIRPFLLLTTVITSVLVIFGSIPQIFILEKFLEPIIEMTYFYIWVKYARKFYNTLKWRVVEFKIRSKNKWIIRRSISSRNQFAIIMSVIGVCIACFIFCGILVKYFFLTATILFYGPCLFHYLYGTPLYQPLLTTHQQIEALRISSVFEVYCLAFFYSIAFTIMGLQYLLVTIVFFGRIVWGKLKYRFGRVKTRFTPRLTDPLLIA